jgi:DNA-binding MarR family transcriptional regulator
MPPKQLPWQVFQLASSLLPYMTRAFEDAQLNPTELFVLSHLKHHGIQDADGRRLMLKNEMRQLLMKVGYSSTRASTIITDLHNKHLVDTNDLTEDERAKIFGSKTGFKPVVILEELGLSELDAFNARIDKTFASLTGGMSETKYKTLMLALTFFAKHASKKIQDLQAADENGDG